MLSKKNRLAKDTDIKRVLSAGRSFFSPTLTLKALPNVLSNARITVVVSTKVSKRAVKRNRLRRVIRSEIEQVLPEVRYGDFLFRVKPGALSVTEEALRREVQFLLRKANLLK